MPLLNDTPPNSEIQASLALYWYSLLLVHMPPAQAETAARAYAHLLVASKLDFETVKSSITR